MTVFKIDIDLFNNYMGNGWRFSKRGSHICLTLLGVEIGVAYTTGIGFSVWYDIEWL